MPCALRLRPQVGLQPGAELVVDLGGGDRGEGQQQEEDGVGEDAKQPIRHVRTGDPPPLAPPHKGEGLAGGGDVAAKTCDHSA